MNLNGYKLTGDGQIEAYGHKLPYEKTAEDSKTLSGIFKVASKSFGFIWDKVAQKLQDLFKKPKLDPDVYPINQNSHTHTHTHTHKLDSEENIID